MALQHDPSISRPEFGQRFACKQFVGLGVQQTHERAFDHSMRKVAGSMSRPLQRTAREFRAVYPQYRLSLYSHCIVGRGSGRMGS